MSEVKSYETDAFPLLLDQFGEFIDKLKETKTIKEVKEYLVDNMLPELKQVKDDYRRYKNQLDNDDKQFLYDRFYDLGYILDDTTCKCQFEENEKYDCEFCGRKCHCQFPNEVSNFKCCGYCSPCLCEEVDEPLLIRMKSEQ